MPAILITIYYAFFYDPLNPEQPLHHIPESRRVTLDLNDEAIAARAATPIPSMGGAGLPEPGSSSTSPAGEWPPGASLRGGEGSA